jgi:hypothetical protein
MSFSDAEELVSLFERNFAFSDAASLQKLKDR